MPPPATPPQALTDILLQILVIATRALRDIHVRAANAHLLKSILAANHAGARIGRAIRLTTLLIRRIQTHGLTPHTPTRRTPAQHAPAMPDAIYPAPTPALLQGAPRLHTGNADAAFIRRPIPTIIAAITRELHLAARILGIPLPDHLQALCLHAALTAGNLPPASPPAQAPLTPPCLEPTQPNPGPFPGPFPATPQPGRPGLAPPPWKTLEL